MKIGRGDLSRRKASIPGKMATHQKTMMDMHLMKTTKNYYSWSWILNTFI